MKETVKIISIILAFTFATPSFAIDTYKSNQGIQPKEFSSTMFTGQWNIEEYDKVTTGLDRQPYFTGISPANIENLDYSITKLKEEGERSEMKRAMKAKEDVKGALTALNFLYYINDNFPSQDAYDAIGFRGQDDANDDAYKIVRSFIKDNDENTIVLNHFKKNGLMGNVDVLVLFNYRKNEIADQRALKGWTKGIEKMKKKNRFDVKNGVDFFMIDTRKNLFGIDFVDKDTFILYNVIRANHAVFKRSTKHIESKTYNQMFKEIDKKVK